MKTNILSIAVWLAAVGLPADASAQTAVLETSMGEIAVQLDSRHAPKTVDAFLTNARFGLYDNTIFHRVVKGFVVQGGELNYRSGESPQTIGNEARVPAFEPEVRNGLRNLRGTIAATRIDPSRGFNMAPTGFFINVSDNPFLDYQRFDKPTVVPTLQGPQEVPAGTETEAYVVFGRVLRGMEIVDKMASAKTRQEGYYEAFPETPIILRNVRIER